MPIPFIVGALGAGLVALTTVEVIALIIAAFSLGAYLSSGTKEDVYIKVRESGYNILAIFIDLTDEKTFAIIKDRFSDSNDELSEEENIKKIIQILQEEVPHTLQEIERNIDKKIKEIDDIYKNQMLENLKELKKFIDEMKMKGRYSYQ